MTARQTRFFAHAKSAAEMSDFRVRVGAVIVLGKQILSVGFSSTRSHSVQARYDKYRNFRSGSEPKHSLHAEMMALIPLMNDKDIDWKRVEIYVFRISEIESSAWRDRVRAVWRRSLNMEFATFFIRRT